MAREVKVAILGDARDFARAVDRTDRDARRLDGSLGKLGRGFGSLAKSAAIGAAGLGVGAVALGKSFVDAAQDGMKVTAQTNAVIKSMGGAANKTADQVVALSESLARKTGVDDELIQSGQNVLMTFGGIRNEVGKGNDIFDRATKATLDMSVALGTDMKSASLQVGKALNDPVRGLAALRRSGIQFTKQQEDQIKAMVEVGDTAGAQKVMLAELERQFGGSAAAQATATSKLKANWEILKGELGEKLIPVIDAVANWLSDRLPAAVAKAEVWFKRISVVVAQVVEIVRQHWPRVQEIITQVVTVIGDVIAGFVEVATTLWDNFGNNILEFVQRVWPRIQQVIDGALAIIRGIIQTVTSLIKGDWSGVWEGIKGIVSGVWSAIQGIIGTALEVLRSVIGAGLEIIGSAIRGFWNGIVDFISKIPNRITIWALKMWDGAKAAARSAVEWILSQIERVTRKLDEAVAKFKALVPGQATGDDIDRVRAITSRAQGGTVPGSLGQPRMILAHGGEQVVTHGQQFRAGSGGGSNVVNIYVSGNDPTKVVEAVSRYIKQSGQPAWLRTA